MNRIEINKELLSEVLDINDIVHVQKEGNNSIFISRANNPAYIISVYEFAFKCKEWAFKRELNLWTDYLGNCSIQDKDFQFLHDCHCDTELKAIIRACEWIVKKTK